MSKKRGPRAKKTLSIPLRSEGDAFNIVSLVDALEAASACTTTENRLADGSKATTEEDEQHNHVRKQRRRKGSRKSLQYHSQQHFVAMTTLADHHHIQEPSFEIKISLPIDEETRVQLSPADSIGSEELGSAIFPKMDRDEESNYNPQMQRKCEANEEGELLEHEKIDISKLESTPDCTNIHSAVNAASDKHISGPRNGTGTKTYSNMPSGDVTKAAVANCNTPENITESSVARQPHSHPQQQRVDPNSSANIKPAMPSKSTNNDNNQQATTALLLSTTLSSSSQQPPPLDPVSKSENSSSTKHHTNFTTPRAVTNLSPKRSPQKTSVKCQSGSKAIKHTGAPNGNRHIIPAKRPGDSCHQVDDVDQHNKSNSPNKRSVIVSQLTGAPIAVPTIHASRLRLSATEHQPPITSTSATAAPLAAPFREDAKGPLEQVKEPQQQRRKRITSSETSSRKGGNKRGGETTTKTTMQKPIERSNGQQTTAHTSENSSSQRIVVSEEKSPDKKSEQGNESEQKSSDCSDTRISRTDSNPSLLEADGMAKPTLQNASDSIAEMPVLPLIAAPEGANKVPPRKFGMSGDERSQQQQHPPQSRPIAVAMPMSTHSAHNGFEERHLTRNHQLQHEKALAFNDSQAPHRSTADYWAAQFQQAQSHLPGNSEESPLISQRAAEQLYQDSLTSVYQRQQREAEQFAAALRAANDHAIRQDRGVSALTNRVEVAVVGSPEIFGLASRGQKQGPALDTSCEPTTVVTLDSVEDERIIERCDLGTVANKPVTISSVGESKISPMPVIQQVNLRSSLCLPTTARLLASENAVFGRIPSAESNRSPDSHNSTDGGTSPNDAHKRRSSFSHSSAPPKKRFMQHHNDDIAHGEEPGSPHQRQTPASEPVRSSSPVGHIKSSLHGNAKATSDSAIAQSTKLALGEIEASKHCSHSNSTDRNNQPLLRQRLSTVPFVRQDGEPVSAVSTSSHHQSMNAINRQPLPPIPPPKYPNNNAKDITASLLASQYGPNSVWIHQNKLSNASQVQMVQPRQAPVLLQAPGSISSGTPNKQIHTGQHFAADVAMAKMKTSPQPLTQRIMEIPRGLQPQQAQTVASSPQDMDLLKKMQEIKSLPIGDEFQLSLNRWEWATLDSLRMPVIFRGQDKFVAVHIVQMRLLSKFPPNIPGDMMRRFTMVSHKMTLIEAWIFNTVNALLCKFDFGCQLFTTQDEVVKMADVEKFYWSVKSLNLGRMIENYRNELKFTLNNHSHLTATITQLRAQVEKDYTDVQRHIAVLNGQTLPPSVPQTAQQRHSSRPAAPAAIGQHLHPQHQQLPQRATVLNAHHPQLPTHRLMSPPGSQQQHLMTQQHHLAPQHHGGPSGAFGPPLGYSDHHGHAVTTASTLQHSLSQQQQAARSFNMYQQQQQQQQQLGQGTAGNSLSYLTSAAYAGLQPQYSSASLLDIRHQNWTSAQQVNGGLNYGHGGLPSAYR